MSDLPHPSCVGDYETISDDKENGGLCPSCKRKTLVPDTMLEEGVSYPVMNCTNCPWWG